MYCPFPFEPKAAGLDEFTPASPVKAHIGLWHLRSPDFEVQVLKPYLRYLCARINSAV